MASQIRPIALPAALSAIHTIPGNQTLQPDVRESLSLIFGLCDIMGNMSSSDPTSRRNFLRGRVAGRDTSSESDQQSANRAATSSTDPTSRAYLTSVGRRAMACQFQAFFNAGQYEQAEEAAIEALDLVERIEAQLTVYRPDSELSQLNQNAGEDSVEVEENLFELIEQSLDLTKQTAGAFDVTAGPLSQVWGFARGEGRLPKESELAEALAHVGSRLLHLDADARSVHYLDPLVEINLGGIGKGYALDEAADAIEEEGVADFLLHGGQSSVIARGRNADRDRGWSVGLVHPLNPKQRLAELILVDKALSTSGSGTQLIRHQGRRLGHILDPRTGWPAEGVLSATVVTEAAAEADALSTALFVMGADRAREFCATRTDVGAVMIVPGERDGTVKIEAFNLADNDWKLLDH